MRVLLPVLLVALLLPILLLASPSFATPANHDFSSGLDAWTLVGNLSADDGAARLSDAGSSYSAIYQGDPLAAGPITLSFDFRTELSSSVPSGPFGFPDTFFATLYLTDDLAAFDLTPGSFGDAISLFDHDYAGAFNLSGAIGASSNRAGWLAYELEFDSPLGYAIPTFELVEQNFVDGDSSVWIDNVMIEPVGDAGAPIPEPSAALLFALGVFIVSRRVRSGSDAG